MGSFTREEKAVLNSRNVGRKAPFPVRCFGLVRSRALTWGACVDEDRTITALTRSPPSAHHCSIPHNTTRAFGEQFTSNRITEPQVGFTKAQSKAYERQYLTAEHCKHMVSNYTSALYNVPIPKANGLNYAYGTMSVRAPPMTLTKPYIRQYTSFPNTHIGSTHPTRRRATKGGCVFSYTHSHRDSHSHTPSDRMPLTHPPSPPHC